ncbi:ATP-binding protein [Desulfohalovibrio reitneri]|uniref:ATP-binding protein n=1 Tax=Desulfohalovibrio reitneri TaxID=1307759 RepID=UPI0004A77FD2|nr:ATP-binding protein [Desulfohalovibrio reitneri]
MKCRRCRATAQVKLPSHHTGFCPECFDVFFSRQVAKAIKDHSMIRPGERVLVALSGGKDSLGLARELARQGHDITGLHVYLGIAGSSDQVLGKVDAFCQRESIPLQVASAPEEGLAIPLIKECLTRPVCAACGAIKRHLFNKAAMDGGFEALATGHNLDDETARLFANTLRWDDAYLADQGPVMPARQGFARRIKPLYRLGEYETAAYAFLAGIDHGTAACPYSPGASFTHHKELLAGLEERSPGAKLQFYENFLKRGRPAFEKAREAPPDLSPCLTCGFPTQRETCTVCAMREAVREAAC